MRYATRLFVAILPLLSGIAPAMALHIVNPWPDPETVQDVREEIVTPPGAPARHGTPAVVMLYGSAGRIYGRALYGPQLAAMGVAVLLVKTYDSRTDLATGFIDRALNITETMFVADAYAALHYLATRPEIDAHRVALLGFSYGGMATEYAIYAQLANAFAPSRPAYERGAFGRAGAS